MEPQSQTGGWYSSQEMELRIQRLWEERGIFRKLLAKNAHGEPWSFLDGPITANNPMGIHHAWGRSLKDAYQRYHAMQGRRLRYQNGFDCQGLWVEVEVEKELGLRSKREIEAYGVARFVERCKERVRTYARKITEQSVRLGTWMDWDNSYYTMSDRNNYTIWGFLKRCHERGLTYQGHDVMPWCPRCGTGISQHEMQEGYRTVKHRAATVAMAVVGRPDEYLLAWTTTPWTLTANVALAVHPDLVYVAVRVGNRVYHLAESRAQAVLAARGPWTVVDRRKGSVLAEAIAAYTGPYDHLEPARVGLPHRVIAWTEVRSDEGTGVVHVAPGCGPEDFRLSREHGLPAPCPLDADGRFLPGYGDLGGHPASEASRRVLEDMKRRGLVFAEADHTHAYPHCWRCGHELVYRLVDEWFIAMDPWREDIVRSVRTAAWIPGFCRDLELDWLKNMRDWMISKKRYWGLALPIWVCETCAHFEVMGSRQELETRAATGWETFRGHSPHRPYIDQVTIRCARCGSPARRIPDVGNPWLDAGIVPYSTTGYGEGEEWRTWVPADLVVEGFPQQFRGWFYSLLAMSTMLEGTAPFRVLLGHASVRDERGEEMHKSKGNAIWLDDALESTGADTVRWLFYGQDLATDLDFSFKTARAIRGGFLNTLWNCHTFFLSYAALNAGATAVEPGRDGLDNLERWILSRLNRTVLECKDAWAEHDLRTVTRGIEGFVDALSNVYIRQRRRLFWKGAATSDGEAAFRTLGACLLTLCRLIAPLMPHLAEEMYQRLTGVARGDLPESVHLCDYPVADRSRIDPGLENAMVLTARVQQVALSARKTAGRKARQPLAELWVRMISPEDRERLAVFQDVLRQEVNVHVVRLETGAHDPAERRWTAIGGGVMWLDTRLTPVLEREGLARDLLRRLQLLRRERGLGLTDRIEIKLAARDPAVVLALSEHRGFLMEELLCVKLDTTEVGADAPVLDVGTARVGVEMRKSGVAVRTHIPLDTHTSLGVDSGHDRTQQGARIGAGLPAEDGGAPGD